MFNQYVKRFLHISNKIHNRLTAKQERLKQCTSLIMVVTHLKIIFKMPKISFKLQESAIPYVDIMHKTRRSHR